MSTGPGPDVEAAMRRLQAAERERRAAIEELIQLGAVRSHVLVGDVGERVAAEYYGVGLLPQFTPGHDLVDRRDRRVDVKTLRSTPERPRTIIGQLKRPCDLVFALRLHYDYTPAEALEIPIELAETYLGANGKLSWTQKLASEPAVVHLDAAQIARGDRHAADPKRPGRSAVQHPQQAAGVRGCPAPVRPSKARSDVCATSDLSSAIHPVYPQAMAKTRKVERESVESLFRRMSPPAVGATAAHPDIFPSGLGIGRREEPRNRYLGVVLTRPAPDTLVLGLNYFDAADNCDNEDMYRLDMTTLDLTPYMRGAFEREHPEYTGHHRATKTYLRRTPPKR